MILINHERRVSGDTGVGDEGQEVVNGKTN